MFNPEAERKGLSDLAHGTLREIAIAVPSHIGVAEQQGLDPLYVIPLHQSVDRFETIKTTVRSVVAQRGRSNTELPTLILADNGVDEHAMRGVVEYMQISGVDVRVVDARPKVSTEKNAAHARNQALNHIASLREQNEQMRGPIVLMDSDSAFVEDDAMLHLLDTLEKHPRAQSVNGVVTLVSNVKQGYDQRSATKIGNSNNSSRVLPSLWRSDGSADLAAIVAFSSQIAGKTTGQLLRAGSVGPNNAYVQMPNGSAEDMIAALYQSRRGEICLNEQVHIIDQDRPNPDASLQQQMQWGEDHVYLQHALAQVGAQHRGILVLEPTEEGWLEWIVANTEDISGVVVHPVQLHQLLVNMRTGAHPEQSDTLGRDFFQLESTRLANVLTLLEERRGWSRKHVRTDLPRPINEAHKDGRYSDAAQTGRLLGNMLGVHALHACDNVFTIPQTFLYGMRQRAEW